MFETIADRARPRSRAGVPIAIVLHAGALALALVAARRAPAAKAPPVVEVVLPPRQVGPEGASPGPAAPARHEPVRRKKPRTAAPPREMPAPLSEEPARPVAEPLPAGEDERGTAIGGAVGEGGGSESSGEANDEASGPREFQDSMIPPQRISGPDPQYTPEALEREVEGTMRVKCVVTVEGTVHGCRVLQSLPFMDRAVIEALERRRYTPARENGRPVEVEYVFVIRLKL